MEIFADNAIHRRSDTAPPGPSWAVRPAPPPPSGPPPGVSGPVESSAVSCKSRSFPKKYGDFTSSYPALRWLGATARMNTHKKPAFPRWLCECAPVGRPPYSHTPLSGETAVCPAAWLHRWEA